MGPALARAVRSARCCGTAIVSLVFVVALSKLQYVLTSRLVGGEVDSQAWEILFAIIVGEAAFGISGVIMAPIVYAFVKGELLQVRLFLLLLEGVCHPRQFELLQKVEGRLIEHHIS